MAVIRLPQHVLKAVCTLTHNQQMTPGSLREYAGLTQKQADSAITSLKHRGYLRSASRGHYYITRLGMDEIPLAIAEIAKEEDRKKPLTASG